MRNKRIIATLAAVAASALVPAAGAQAASKSPSATVSTADAAHTANAGQPRDLAGAPATESPGAQQSAMGGGSVLLSLIACLGMDYTLHDGNAPSDTEDDTEDSGAEDTGTEDSGAEDTGTDG